MNHYTAEQIQNAIRSDVLAFGYQQSGAPGLARQRAIQLLKGTATRQPFPQEADPTVQLPYTIPETPTPTAQAAGASSLAPDLSYNEIAREVLTELADALHSGQLEYGAGNASAAVRDWMNEQYADDSNSEWPGRVD